jgi:hypothetical protein
MVTRKTTLAESLQRAAGTPPPVAELSTALEAETAAGQRYVAPARRGKKAVSGHFDPAVQKQLNQIALDEDSSVQALLREALNDLFAKRGKPTIA